MRRAIAPRCGQAYHSQTHVRPFRRGVSPRHLQEGDLGFDRAVPRGLESVWFEHQRRVHFARQHGRRTGERQAHHAQPSGSRHMPAKREKVKQAKHDGLLSGRTRNGCQHLLRGRDPAAPATWAYGAQGTALVELADVLWIRADGDYSQLRMLDGRSELHDKSLAGLSVLLPPDFVRCHRSYVVNLRHVRSLHAGSGSRYWLVLTDGVELRAGRAYIAALRHELALA